MRSKRKIKMQMPEHLASIPGYAAAVKRENDIWDAAFLNLNARICGIEIRQITLKHWLILDAAENALLQSERPPTAYDLAIFFWVLSPSFRPHSPIRRWWFLRKVRKIDYADATVKIRQFVADSFQDLPPQRGGSDWEAPSYSFIVSVLTTVCEKLHWSREVVLNLPLKETFQYLKIIRMQNTTTGSGAAAQLNPSDLVWFRAVKKARAERDAEKLKGQKN